MHALVPTIHLVYILPKTLGFAGLINLAASKSGLFSPLYRRGMDYLISWPKPLCAPYSITKHLATAIKKHYNLKLYDWNERTAISMKENDILLFHPKPFYSSEVKSDGMHLTTDTDSIGWKTITKYPGCRSFIITPFVRDGEESWLNSVFQHKPMDMIVICSDYWLQDWQSVPYSSFVKRLLHVNMCIDSQEYPCVKSRFNHKGKRKFIYIGHTDKYKNTDQLEKIASCMPDFSGAHIGHGEIRGWKKIADRVDLTRDNMRKLADEFDIFVNCSTADAQATTILEQMCFGMAIACTPQSGYTYPSITRLDADNTELNCEQLSKLQHAEEEELLHNALRNREYAVKYHSWDTFSEKILEFIKD